MYPSKTPIAELTTKVTPSAVVAKGRWVGFDGAQVASAGVRARGIALANFSQKEVDHNASAAGTPAAQLTIAQFGPAEAELGGTVPDNSFVTVDATGRTIAATTANHEKLAYCEKGGAVGQTREIFILRNDNPRVAAANISVPAAISGGESPTEAEHNALRTTVAAIVAALEAHGISAEA